MKRIAFFDAHAFEREAIQQALQRCNRCILNEAVQPEPRRLSGEMWGERRSFIF